MLTHYSKLHCVRTQKNLIVYTVMIPIIAESSQLGYYA